MPASLSPPRHPRAASGRSRNTRQITKAMKMVSAAKLRRAQDAIVRAPAVRARRSSDAARASLARARGPRRRRRRTRCWPSRRCSSASSWCCSPATAASPARSTRTSSGARSASSPRTADQYQPIAVLHHRPQGARLLPRPQASPIAQGLRRRSSSACASRWRRTSPTSSSRASSTGEVDAVFLCYNEFKSAIAAERGGAPAPAHRRASRREAARRAGLPDFIYEPAAARAARRSSFPRHLAIQVWRALLDSAASEHGARMTAMESATKNAERDDRGAHPPVQPRAPGLRHEGADGDRERRRGARSSQGALLARLPKRRTATRRRERPWPRASPPGRQDHPGHRPGRRRRVPARARCRRSTPRSR